MHQVLTRDGEPPASSGIDVDRLCGVSRGPAVVSLPAVLAAKAAPHEFYLSLGAGCRLIPGRAALLGPCRPASSTKWLAGRPAAPDLRMAGNYIYPVYYLLTRSADRRCDPYRGAPYIGYLKSNTAAHERVFGRDGILHPNWAGSFQLADIRGLDAMYYRKYFDFIRFFLREEMPPLANGDLVEPLHGGR
jgi:hypothetical protein